MTYDPSKVKLYKLTGGASLGWTLRLGESRLGQADDIHTSVRLSALSLTDGYTTGDMGELSIDPATATAAFAEGIRLSGDVEAAAPSVFVSAPLNVGDRVSIEVGNVINFQGAVRSVGVKMSASMDPRYHYIRRYTYSITGVSGMMMDHAVPLSTLPAEDPLTRLRRYFEVDVSALAPEQLNTVLSTTVEAVTDPQQATYLDAAREFTKATLLPVRPVSVLPARWDQLEVLGAPIAWDGVPPVPVLYGTDEWSTSVDYESSAQTAGEYLPTALSVKENDTRFLSGFSDISVPPAPLGDLRLGVSRLGESATVRVGFQAPDVIDIFGQPMCVARIAQTFGAKYRAELELAPPMVITTEV